MWSRSRLWMVLHGKEGQVTMANALDGSIIEIHVRNLERGRTRDAAGLANYREAMVLSCDQDLPTAEVAHRMIAPAVTVRQLGGRTAIRQAHQLMAQADSEGGKPRIGQLANILQSVADGRRITRPVGKKETVGS